MQKEEKYWKEYCDKKRGLLVHSEWHLFFFCQSRKSLKCVHLKGFKAFPIEFKD